MRSCRSRTGDGLGRVFVSRGRGFTMVELLVAIGLLGVLAALLMSTFGPARSTARRATCDSRVKALSIALDAFRQERGRYPRSLLELVGDKYISDREMMRCPDDTDLSSKGYDAFYIVRGARNNPRWTMLPVVGQLPVIVCPFHEKNGVGVQAFGGLQTHQFATRAAVLVSASAASIKRIDKKDATPARAGMPLHGGDLIQTGEGGAALIQFFDGSRCELSGGAKVTVLQSFLQNGDGDLYTLVRQTIGDVAYSVRHGSKFDVSTPTATAGALGTEFTVAISGEPSSDSYAEWWINYSPNDTSNVYFSSPRQTTIIEKDQWVNVGQESIKQTPINGVLNILPTATPSTTSTPAISPTPTRSGNDGSDNNSGGGNG